MKKSALIILLILTVLALTACGGTEQKGSDFSVDSLKTFGDILALGSETEQSSTSEDTLVYVFDVDGVYYRAISTIDKELSDKIFNLEYDDDHDKNFNELISPVAIDRIEDLTDQILSQEELDKLVGKTYQELLDEGWYTTGYDLGTMEFWMNSGPFLYKVTLDGQVDEDQYDTFNEDVDTLDMKVVKAEYMDIGNAADID